MRRLILTLVMLGAIAALAFSPAVPVGQCSNCTDSCDLLYISLYNNCVVAYGGGAEAACAIIAASGKQKCLIACTVEDN